MNKLNKKLKKIKVPKVNEWGETEESWDDWKEWNKQLKEKEKKEKKVLADKKKKTTTIKLKEPIKIQKIKKKMRLKLKRKGIKRVEKEKEMYDMDWEARMDCVGVGLNDLLETGPERIVLRKILEKLPKRKSYVRERCHYRFKNGNRCKLPAVGSGQLCQSHGGKIVTGEGHDTLTAIIQTMLNKNSKYHPVVHPLDFIKMSKRGMSDIEIAAEFNVSAGTLRSWAEKYNDFGEAYEIGQTMYEAWWLNKGVGGLDDTRNFNTPLYKFLTGNKLGYSDKIETKNTNINHGVLVVPGMQSIEEWEGGKKQIEDKNVMDAEYDEK